jgi:hypothetical protein
MPKGIRRPTMKRVFKTRGIFLAMLLALFVAASLPMAAFADTSDPYLNLYDGSLSVPIYKFVIDNDIVLQDFYVSPSATPATNAPPSFFDSAADAMAASLSIVLDTPPSISGASVAATQAIQIGANQWILEVLVAFPNDGSFGSLNVMVANPYAVPINSAHADVTYARQEALPWQGVSAHGIEVRIYDPASTAYYGATGMTVDNNDFYENPLISFPTSLDGLYHAYYYGGITGNVHNITTGINGMGTYVNSMTVNGVIYGLAGNTGWQYRVYDAQQRDMVSLSEFVGADSIRLAQGDIVVWKYGAYGDPVDVGDRIDVNFKNLKTPVQKLGGIYNPGIKSVGGSYTVTDYVAYDTGGGQTLESQKTQWAFKPGMDISLDIAQKGVTALTNGRIYSQHYGYPFGYHRIIPKEGNAANLNALSVENDVWHSTLPDIVFSTERKADPDPDPDPDDTNTDNTDTDTGAGGGGYPVDDDTTNPESPSVVVEIGTGNDSFNPSTGVETVTVTPGTIASAIGQAVTAASAAGSEPTIVIKAEAAATGDAVREVNVDIPVSDLRAVADSAAREISVKIESAAGEITLNKAAVMDLVSGAGSADTVEVVIRHTDDVAADPELTAGQKIAAVGADVREVYDVSLFVGNSPIDFVTADGKLTVGLPYALDIRAGEAAAGVQPVYLPGEGGRVPMNEGKKYERGLSIFQTDHLSVYAVTYVPRSAEDAAGTEGGGSGWGQAGGSGSGGGCGTGIAGIAALLTLALARARRRKAAKG